MIDEPIHLHPGRVTRNPSAPDTERSDVRKAGPSGGGPTGGFVTLEGERYYKISQYDRMAPFLMTLASDADLWMFVASGGGLTAGRVDADGSIFPYVTSDKLHDARYYTGPVTLIRARRSGGSPVLWQPFAGQGASQRERNLYKNVTGSRLIFEEINQGLGLAFRYRWAACDTFGWVRTATIDNVAGSPVTIELMDGLRNILPWGVSQSLEEHASNLADAYKKSEIDRETGLGIYSLTAGITDRPEAVEVLRANTVWCAGLDNTEVLLAPEALDAFRRGETHAADALADALADAPDDAVTDAPADAVLNGRRGNYLVTSSFSLDPGRTMRWHMAVDAGRSHLDIARLRKMLLDGHEGLLKRVDVNLDRAGDSLRRNVASADGLQLTRDERVSAHHFANVLFNNMRGGVFADNNRVETRDLAAFMRSRNRTVAERNRLFLSELPDFIDISALVSEAAGTGDPDLERLCYEYLPLHFGRRHGDPSRPWNRFSIHVRNVDGTKALRYEGNWRDIFQNWEALSMSFPHFLPGIIAKFVNASTVDGHNPYRITRDGVEWETIEEGNPWSHIGYWGDHQIIYLLKLLEGQTRYFPGQLESMLARRVFSYADVPYRIRPYDDILRDPHATIDFDDERAARVDERVEALGSDGRLVANADGSVVHVTLLEKLLVPLLSKLSNLVPGGGVWMNTQRPEWNDANNALVGNGVSVVTMCYLRRYASFLARLLSREGVAGSAVPVSVEVVEWLSDVAAALEDHVLHREAAERAAAGGETEAPGFGDDVGRKRALDALGRAFSRYRERVYGSGFSGTAKLPVTEAGRLCTLALSAIDDGIRANRREDGLYNAYVLMKISEDGDKVSLRPLGEMLEGQVAVLSSGLPDAHEAATITEQLFRSRLYRPEQRSFMLYPDRKLPGFLERNVVPADAARSIPLLRDLLEAGEGCVIAKDAFGVLRFSADLRNGEDLTETLDRPGSDPTWSERVARDRAAVLALFEDVFDHASYTGRSGAMYAYEGLGSIYWHMVAKLLLAVQEVALRSRENGGEEADAGAAAEDSGAEALARLYHRIRSGLGFEKEPAEYGAFPMDPYSHTPAHGGAKQPGMTGQVKEEILTRLAELGVMVQDGAVSFSPHLLGPDEFLNEARAFCYYDVLGVERSIELRAGSLAFTFCQVPVVYEAVEGKGWIRVTLADGAFSERSGNALDDEQSRALFDRREAIVRIDVGVPVSALRRS